MRSVTALTLSRLFEARDRSAALALPRRVSRRLRYDSLLHPPLAL